MIQQWLVIFAHDTKVHVAIALVALDFILGCAAALYVGNFRLAYVAQVLRSDVLGKLLPYLAFYVVALVAGSEEWLPIPGLDFGFLAGAAYLTLVTAISASILNSLKQIKDNERQPLSISQVLAGDENPA